MSRDGAEDYRAFMEFKKMCQRFGREKVKMLYGLTEDEAKALEKLDEAMKKIKDCL